MPRAQTNTDAEGRIVLLDAKECARRIGVTPKHFRRYSLTQPGLVFAERPLGGGPKPRRRWIEKLFTEWQNRGDERRKAAS